MIKRLSILFGLLFLVFSIPSMVYAATYRVDVGNDMNTTNNWKFYENLGGFSDNTYSTDNSTDEHASFRFRWYPDQGGYYSGYRQRGYLQFYLPEIVDPATISSVTLHNYIIRSDSGAELWHVDNDAWVELSNGNEYFFNLLDKDTDDLIYNITDTSKNYMASIDLLASGIWDFEEDFDSGDRFLSLALVNYYEFADPRGLVSPSVLTFWEDFYTIATKDQPNPNFDPYLVIETVPIPAAAWLFLSSLIGIAGIRRKLKK